MLRSCFNVYLFSNGRFINDIKEKERPEIKISKDNDNSLKRNMIKISRKSIVNRKNVDAKKEKINLAVSINLFGKVL